MVSHDRSLVLKNHATPDPKINTNWYKLNVEETLNKLETDGSGLTSAEVVERHEIFGFNGLEFKKPSVFARLVRQFNNPLVFILLAAFAMTMGLTLTGSDMLVDSGVILAVVIYVLRQSKFISFFLLILVAYS